MSDKPPPNNLQRIVAEEGLSYTQLTLLSQPQAQVGAKTMGDLARRKRWGTQRSWVRILQALNAKDSKRKNYSMDDLLGDAYTEHRRRWIGEP